MLDVIIFSINRRFDLESLKSENTKNTIKNDSQSRDIRFKLRDELIYYTSKKNKKRLYISTNMKQNVFRIIHDLSNHEKFYRIYDRLVNSIYVRQLIKRLRTYIEHCSKCQLN